MHQLAIATVKLQNRSTQTEGCSTISTFSSDHSSIGQIGQLCFGLWVHELTEITLL